MPSLFLCVKVRARAGSGLAGRPDWQPLLCMCSATVVLPGPQGAGQRASQSQPGTSDLVPGAAVLAGQNQGAQVLATLGAPTEATARGSAPERRERTRVVQFPMTQVFSVALLCGSGFLSASQLSGPTRGRPVAKGWNRLPSGVSQAPSTSWARRLTREPQRGTSGDCPAHCWSVSTWLGGVCRGSLCGKSGRPGQVGRKGLTGRRRSRWCWGCGGRKRTASGRSSVDRRRGEWVLFGRRDGIRVCRPRVAGGEDTGRSPGVSFGGM